MMFYTPLSIATKAGHTQIVKLLLNDERIPVNQVQHFNQTPFFIACEKGHIEIVKLLLNDERVDINKANLNGTTPFCVACFFGLLEIVEYMLASGRDVNLAAKEKSGDTALDVARKRSVSKGWPNEFEFQRRESNRPKMIKLIESFERNPSETRFNLRIQLGLAGIFLFSLSILFLESYFFLGCEGASIYAIVVLLSDHYLRFKHI